VCHKGRKTLSVDEASYNEHINNHEGDTPGFCP
jgi:hypothetical protein